MYISRHMGKTMMELNDQYPVILLTGHRQVGKTTMLEHLMKAEGGGHSGIPGRVALLHLSPLSQSEIMNCTADGPFLLDLPLLLKRQKNLTAGQLQGNCR